MQGTELSDPFEDTVHVDCTAESTGTKVLLVQLGDGLCALVLESLVLRQDCHGVDGPTGSQYTRDHCSTVGALEELMLVKR